MTEQKIAQMNPVLLAFIGDAVQTLYVRESLIQKDLKIGELHKRTSNRVCAKTQAQKFDQIFEKLSEQEKEIANRARNIKHNTIPKSCTVADYHKATALESVIGYNYLLKNDKRLIELLQDTNEEK